MARTTRRAKGARDTSAQPPSGMRLWAPWRYTYLRSAAAVKPRCIFCFARLNAAGRRKRLVLAESASAVVMLNRYPYNNGHLMVAPRRHVASPELLTRDERVELGELVTRAVKILRAELRPAGLNVGANLGRSAGAGIAEHMHWHVVPRWDGDNNFMPVLASTRVLSQSLEDSYAQLSPLFKTIAAGLS
ncbi:MAG TPA: HIT domain-containing protein [Candidatus Binataceae bacterium]|nr:HIT domain-containing protein [Candidatus Binataceae bacterium]